MFTGDPNSQNLSDPQSLNSYSYARNNPIVKKDPEGRYFESAFDVAMLAWSISAFKNDPSLLNAVGVFLDGLSLALPGMPAVGGALLRLKSSTFGNYVSTLGISTSNLLNISFCRLETSVK